MPRVRSSVAGLLVGWALLAGSVGPSAAAPTHGGALAFASSVGVYVMNADGTALRQVTRIGELSGEVSLWPPVWSPDGKRLAVSAIYPASVAVVGLDGNVHRLGSGFDPAWSPDGSKLAFNGGAVVLGERESGLVIVNADGSDLRVLPSGRVDTFSWSPDGTRIAYTVDHGGQVQLVDVASGSSHRSGDRSRPRSAQPGRRTAPSSPLPVKPASS